MGRPVTQMAKLEVSNTCHRCGGRAETSFRIESTTRSQRVQLCRKCELEVWGFLNDLVKYWDGHVEKES